MTTPTYAAELDAALSISSTQESIGSIKAVVAREIKATDSSVQIRDTGYFNHSYMPDFVLEWPDDAAAGQRFMYLKFGGDVDYFVRDVALVEDREPIVFSIGRHRNAGDIHVRLAAEAGTANTLLTDADGLATMIERRDRSPDIRIISTALTQDGRGVLDAVNASAIADGFSQGIDAARALAVEGTRRAAEIVTASLRRRQSRLLNQFLQAVWVGSGGNIAGFPGARDLSGEVTDAALEFLLTGEEITDPVFWRRLGRRASLEQIARLHVDSATRNLQHYVTQNIGALRARSYQLRSVSRNVTDENPPFEWKIERKLLALRAHQFTAYLDGQADDPHGKDSGGRSGGVPLAGLLTRATGTTVTELEIAAEGRTIVYRGEDNIDVTRDKRLAALAESLGPGARVTKARLPIADDRSLVCDFTTQVAAPRGPSRIPVTDLLASLPLLRELTAAESDRLSALLERATDPAPPREAEPGDVEEHGYAAGAGDVEKH